MSVLIIAAEVQRGHSLPGLDNAYIIDVTKQDGYLSVPGSGRFNTAASDTMILFTFNDALGNEGYLMVENDHPILVDQAEPQWVGGW